MDGTDRFPGRDRSALEAIAYGADSDPAIAAAARAELQRRTAPVGGPPPAPFPAPFPAPTPAPTDDAAAAPAIPPRVEVPVPDAPGPAPSRRRLIGLVVGTACLAAVLGVVGTVGVQRLGPTVVRTGSDGATGLRISRVLDAPRTGDDVLPTTMVADVDRSTTHVVYETYPGQPPVHWRVWVASAREGAEICFVITSDGYASDVTCTSRTEALDGVVMFITRDGGEGLSVLDDRGVVGVDLVGVD